MSDIEDLKFKVFDIFQTVRENFDGSEYQQGKKDGLRLALAQMGEIGLARTIRGGDSASPYNVEGMDVGMGYVATLETANAELTRRADKLAEQIEHITKQFPKEPMPDENGEYPIVFIGKSAPVWESMREAVAALREWEQRK